MRRITILLAVAIATLLTAATAPAQAAGPVHEWLSVDETFTWDFCGFPVEEHMVGRLHSISWFDESDKRTREVVAAPGSRITWTNTDTGASVTSGNPYAVHKTDNPDGSVTVMFTGLGFAITGGGRAYISSGRAVIVFSSGGAEFLAGSGPSADLCEALTAAIG